jgi:hypothetical protein
MRTHVLSLLLLSMLAAVADAGTVLEMVNRNLAGGNQESVSTTYAQDGRMRVETQPGDSVMIFKDDTIYNIDNKDRSYTVMDRASMQKLAAQLSPALKQMQEQMAKMSPEQRAQMERMMGGRMPGAAKPDSQQVRKTTRTGTVAGHGCTYVEMLEENVVEEEMCVAPSGALKGGKELTDAAMKLSALLREMLQSFDAPWLKDSIAQQVENYEQLGGVPLSTRHFSSGKPVSESTMKSIRSDAVPADAFAIPAGYTRKDMMQR